MNFFVWRQNVVFSRYLDFCVFVKSTNLKICDVIIGIVTNESCIYASYFWILHTIKLKFGQMLVCCMTNISKMFLAQCCKLETTSRPLYDFIKMTIWSDAAIFNSWDLPFLNVPYLPFQKMKYWNLNIIGY